METSKTSSTVAVVDTGEHLFKVYKHSLLTDANAIITSGTFRVGGHDWAIVYHPNGDASIVDGQFMSMFIQLVSATESDVTASVSLCLQDRASPATGDKNKRSFTKTFLPSMNPKGWGYNQFMGKDAFAASRCLVDDCLVIKCTVEISKLIEDTHDLSADSIIDVPPSDLTTDLGNLLQRGLKADLTIKIGELNSFSVHTSLLAARSPAFLEKLRGSLKESKQSSCICINGMDAKVFEALLHYLYNDCLPGFMEEKTPEAASMARDLLVPANSYGIQRLKLMCESRLSKSLDVNTVSCTLDLAEQYKCLQLKDSCLNYMTREGQRLRTIKETNGFKQLIRKRPLIMCDILDKVADKLKRQAATTPAAPAPPPAP